MSLDKNTASGEILNALDMSPNNSDALKLIHVRKEFLRAESRLVAIEDATFEVERGEFVSLVGPSGCGKTTLLRICASLMAPTAGEVDWMGTGAPISPGSYGMVFQSPALLPWRNILRNVTLPAEVLGINRRVATERARNLLNLVKLEQVEHLYPGELSGGMQQRAGIARALVHDPEILFMDEPFGALDTMTREQLNIELQRVFLDQAKTIIFVTHNIQEAVFLSDKVIVLSSGPSRIVADIKIPLARPRSLKDMTKASFREIEANIRDFFTQDQNTGD